VRSGRPAVVRGLVLDFGADVLGPFLGGHTALCYAAIGGHVDILDFLLVQSVARGQKTTSKLLQKPCVHNTSLLRYDVSQSQLGMKQYLVREKGSNPLSFPSLLFYLCILSSSYAPTCRSPGGRLFLLFLVFLVCLASSCQRRACQSLEEDGCFFLFFIKGGEEEEEEEGNGGMDGDPEEAAFQFCLEESNPPDDMIRPLSLSLMLDPVAAADSFSYERKHLEAHIAFAESKGKPLLSPLTNLPIAPIFVPSMYVKRQV